jgi:hypothetical protein
MSHPDPADEPTVAALIDLLAEFDPDTPVRLATQPAWAFAYTLAPVAAGADGAVYLAAGQQLAYLPDTAGRALAEAGDDRWTRTP